MDFDFPPADPVALLGTWLERAREETDLPNPNAMTLATADADGRPSARIVLLKGLDARGAVFFTNRTSRKGHDLAANPRAALVFHWDRLGLQVRIEGAVTVVADEESDEYFATRPRVAQVGAWASDQSRPIESRAALEARVEQFEVRFAHRDVPRPPHWGGYRVSLGRIEFWRSSEHRIHDRVVYEADGSGGWRTERLSP
jgi:pyridoxamine 5'-phosphate oxidase